MKEVNHGNQIKEIAKFMVDHLQKYHFIEHSTVIARIGRDYDLVALTTKDKDRGIHIHKDILAEFRRMHGGSIKWEPSNKQWVAADPGTYHGFELPEPLDIETLDFDIKLSEK